MIHSTTNLERHLGILPQTLIRTPRDGAELIILQAGADPHMNDPLFFVGGMTSEELRERDELVFTSCHELGMPICWVLSGGYQIEADGSIPVVLEIHTNTALEALRVLSVSAKRENPLPCTPTSSTAPKRRTHIRDTTKENLGKRIAIIGGVRAPRNDRRNCKIPVIFAKYVQHSIGRLASRKPAAHCCAS